MHRAVGASMVVALGMWTTSCQPASTSASAAATSVAKGDPIARIAGTVLTVEQIQERIDNQSPFVRARYADADKKKEFLENQVRFEVLAAEAFSRGLDKDPEVTEAIKKIIVQRLTRDEFDGRVKLQDVTDAEIQAYFETHTSDFNKPAMARVSIIALPVGSDRAQAKKRADDVQRQAADKAKLADKNWFKELAARHSEDVTSKEAGGDLRYVTAEDVEKKLGPAARQWLFAEQALDAVSPVLEGTIDTGARQDVFLVLKRTGWRQEITRGFDQVRNQIRNVVYREKRTASFNAFVESLKTKHGTEVYADKLDRVKVNAQMPPPGAGSGGADGDDDPHSGLAGRPGFGGGGILPSGEEGQAPPVPPATPNTAPVPTGPSSSAE